MYYIVQQFLFFPLISLKVGSSFHIKDPLFNISMVAFGITMEGYVSQIFNLGPSFSFM